jgi:hypothetical protein
VGASIDGGWPGSADGPQERPQPTDALEGDFDPPPLELSAGVSEGIRTPPLREPDDSDPSSDHQVEVHPEDRSPLSESERESVIESAKGFAEFVRRRLISLAADHLLPGLGGRFVDLGFEILDVATSVRALGSDDPVVEVPLPSPVPELGFSLEVPLGSGEDGQSAPPLALCMAPDSPSLTGGWALDVAEHDDQQAAPEAATFETSHAEQLEPRVRRRSATACLVEINLDSPQLPGHRKPRAGALAILASKYASQLRMNPDLARFELLIIADKERRCGVWIWRAEDDDSDLLVEPSKRKECRTASCP